MTNSPKHYIIGSKSQDGSVSYYGGAYTWCEDRGRARQFPSRQEACEWAADIRKLWRLKARVEAVT